MSEQPKPAKVLVIVEISGGAFVAARSDHPCAVVRVLDRDNQTAASGNDWEEGYYEELEDDYKALPFKCFQ